MSEVKTNKISSLASNNDITIDPDGTGDVVVASGHNLGVGTTSPAVETHIQTSSGNPELRIESTGANYVTMSVKNSSRHYSTQIRTDQSNAYVVRDETGGANRFLIDTGGKVGIGTAPSAPLHLATSASGDIAIINTSANSGTGLFINSQTADQIDLVGYDGSAANDVNIRAGGASGSGIIITANGINSATVAGNQTVSSANLFISGGNNFQKSTSSRRYKTDITDASHGLSDVLNLRSVTYKGVNDGETVFGGLIAEEVHDAGLTEFVNYSQDDDGNDVPEGVHYGHMAALAFKAIQELKAELDAEKTKTAALETRVKTLEAGE